MPNGGSDCCGTCWFNTRNKGQAGHAHAGDPEPAHCRIRDFAIPDPFYTYCANHPHRNPERCEIPLGPVFAGEGRALWLRAPDTEELRSYMLNVLARVAPALPREYPIGLHSQASSARRGRCRTCSGSRGSSRAASFPIPWSTRTAA